MGTKKKLNLFKLLSLFCYKNCYCFWSISTQRVIKIIFYEHTKNTKVKLHKFKLMNGNFYRHFEQRLSTKHLFKIGDI